MEKSEFLRDIEEAVADWIAAEESFDDNPYLRVNSESLASDIVDGEDADEADEDGYDYYSVLELVKPSMAGGWIPDPEALEAVASEYF